jgi:Ca-activated chloride channel family protein
VTWEADNVLPTEDFQLFFAPGERGFGGGLLTGSRANQEHFLFLFAPEAGPTQDQVLPKDIVFVIDRSGSMSGEKIRQAQDALHFILSQLDEQDRFSIVGFDHRQSLLSSELLRVTEGASKAHRFVDGLAADGNTDWGGLGRIAGAASASPGKPSDRRVLDRRTAYSRSHDEALIAACGRDQCTGQARLHVFGVGYDVNTHLLDRLARYGEP